ncbi:MAG: hypothetical protein RIQ81_425 [Pseudomonadota bacterium]|jgi:cytochrome oxidase Cu insertion factor (SCO1/SenC/PrrC family)
MLKITNNLRAAIVYVAAAFFSATFHGAVVRAESAYPEQAKYEGRQLADIKLLNVDGKALHLKKDAAFAGKPLVLIPVFTSCPVTCPTILKEFELAWTDYAKALAPAGARVVVVSFDPGDTRKGFKSLLARQKLPADWVYGVAASKSDFKRLEAMLADFDFRYVRLKGQGGGFAHPAGAYILDGEGKVRRFLAQAEFSKDDLTNAFASPKRMEQR